MFEDHPGDSSIFLLLPWKNIKKRFIESEKKFNMIKYVFISRESVTWTISEEPVQHGLTKFK